MECVIRRKTASLTTSLEIGSSTISLPRGLVCLSACTGAPAIWQTLATLHGRNTIGPISWAIPIVGRVPQGPTALRLVLSAASTASSTSALLPLPLSIPSGIVDAMHSDRRRTGTLTHRSSGNSRSGEKVGALSFERKLSTYSITSFLERRATTFRMRRALANRTVPPTARGSCSWGRRSSFENRFWARLDCTRPSFASEAGEGRLGRQGEEQERVAVLLLEPVPEVAFRVRVRWTLETKTLLMQNGLKDLARSRRWGRGSHALSFPPRESGPKACMREGKMSTHGNVPRTLQTGLDSSASPSSGLLKESLAVQLREAILSGKLAPGEKIIERRWARELGAAQVSVREALNILIAEGFVTKGHVRSVIDRVQRFHVCILEKPGNPFLLENGLRLIVPLYAFTLMRALAKNLDASPWVPQVANHQRIVDAIRMGNPQLAEQVVIHVTNHFMEHYLEVWGQ